MLLIAFIAKFLLASGFFIAGGVFTLRWLLGELGTDLKDLILGIILIDNGLGVCLWIYLTR